MPKLAASLSLPSPRDTLAVAKSALQGQKSIWTKKFSSAIVEEYAKFMTLKVNKNDWRYGRGPVLTPSGAIDELWHTHLQHPAKYQAFCESLLGKDRRGQVKVIEHKDVKVSVEERRPRCQATLHAYEAEFGQPAPMELWTDVYEEAKESQSPAEQATVTVVNADNHAQVLGVFPGTFTFNASTEYLVHIDSPFESIDLSEPLRAGAKVALRSYSNADVQVGGELKVKTLTDQVVSFHMEDCAHVGDLAQAVYNHMGICPEQQRLIYAGQQLPFYRTKRALNIPRDATISLVLRLRGC